MLIIAGHDEFSSTFVFPFFNHPHRKLHTLVEYTDKYTTVLSATCSHLKSRQKVSDRISHEFVKNVHTGESVLTVRRLYLHFRDLS